MPLSEDEERILKEMADNLYKDDPSLASTLRTGQTRGRRATAALGVILSVSGMAVLVLGVPTGFWFLGVAGFLMALAGVYLIVGYKPTPAVPSGENGGKSQNGTAPLRGAKNEGFMNKVNKRWDDRRRESGLE